MSIAENSILLRFLLGIWQILAGAWGESAVGRVFARIGRAICRWVQGSALCQFVWREGTLPKSWRESVSCSLFTLILNLPCTLVRWIYRVGKGVWDGSLVFRALSAMGGASFFLMGLFLLVMLIAPHQIWNNAYGLLGAVGVTALFVVGSASRPKHHLESAIFGPYMLFYLMCIGCALVASLSTRLSMRFFSFHVISFLIVVLVVSSV